MANSHRKGREGENRLQTWFTVRGYEAELLRLQGVNDPGDLWVPKIDTRIQLKNHRNMVTALSEAVLDVEKLDQRFPLSKNYSVVARPGKSPGDWYVVRLCKSEWPILPGSDAQRFGGTPQMVDDDDAAPTS